MALARYNECAQSGLIAALTGRLPRADRFARCGSIEIEFVTGTGMRITGAVGPATFDGGGRGVVRWAAAMIPVPSGVRVWTATSHTDMRRGMNSLVLLVQEAFKVRASAWTATSSKPSRERGSCYCE